MVHQMTWRMLHPAATRDLFRPLSYVSLHLSFHTSLYTCLMTRRYVSIHLLLLYTPLASYKDTFLYTSCFIQVVSIHFLLHASPFTSLSPSASYVFIHLSHHALHAFLMRLMPFYLPVCLEVLDAFLQACRTLPPLPY